MSQKVGTLMKSYGFVMGNSGNTSRASSRENESTRNGLLKVLVKAESAMSLFLFAKLG